MSKDKIYSLHGCFTIVLFNITVSLQPVVQKIFGLGRKLGMTIYKQKM